MSTFTLGHVQVRRSGYGAMQLADPYAFGPPPDRASAISVLRAAVAAGVDHIDTAQYHGVVNDLIREALYPYAVTCLPGELSQPRRDRVPSGSADAPSPGVPGQSSQPLDEGMTSRTRSRCVQELLTRQSVPSERESCGGLLLSGVDRSAGPGQGAATA